MDRICDCRGRFFRICPRISSDAALPPGQDERSLVFDGLKQTCARQIYRLDARFLCGAGGVNAVTTWIEDVVTQGLFNHTGRHGRRTDDPGRYRRRAGHAFASDRARSESHSSRWPWLARSWVCGITYAQLLAAACLGLCDGFFLLSAGPIGFQYGAEVPIQRQRHLHRPVVLMGQISGIALSLAWIVRSPGTGSMSRTRVLIG